MVVRVTASRMFISASCVFEENCTGYVENRSPGIVIHSGLHGALDRHTSNDPGGEAAVESATETCYPAL